MKLHPVRTELYTYGQEVHERVTGILGKGPMALPDPFSRKECLQSTVSVWEFLIGSHSCSDKDAI